MITSYKRTDEREPDLGHGGQQLTRRLGQATRGKGAQKGNHAGEGSHLGAAHLSREIYSWFEVSERG